MIINPFFLGSGGGGGGGSVNLTNHTITGLGADGVNGASGSMQLNADGTAAEEISVYGGGPDTVNPFAGEWLVSGLNTEFEAKMTTVSGTCSGSATGSWLALTSDLAWTRSRSIPAGIGTTTYEGTLELRRTSDSVVVETAAITLNASIDP